MPSTQDWLAALTTPKRISVEASQRLADDVNLLPPSRSFQGQSKQAQPPAIIPSRTVTLTVADLLLSLGKITTPRVQNIVDLSNLWAYFRYTWAFDPDLGFGNMRLSEDAWEIDFHQKTLMSDDMGVGFTAFLMENYYNAPSSTDVEVALRNQRIPRLQRQSPRSPLPDYLFQDIQGNYYVVECKGTRQSRKPMLKQIRRGLEQVPSLIFPSGQQPVRLVIGARLSKQAIEVYIVDPPASKDEFNEKGKNKQPVYDIKDVELFEKDVQSVRRANLFLFAGVTGKAIDAYPHEKEKEKLKRSPLVQEPPTSIRSAELEKNFVGTSQPIKLSTGGEKVSVFQGVSERVYHAIEENDISSAAISGFEIYQDAQKISHEKTRDNTKSTVISDMTNHRLRVDVFSKDGSMLRIEVHE